MGRKENNRKMEIIILFSLFYLPAYLFQGGSTEQGSFTDPLYNIHLWFLLIPQIALIIYLIGRGETYSLFGLKKPSMRDILAGLLTIMLLILIVGLLSLIFTIINDVYIGKKELFFWKLESAASLPLVFITCLLTGFAEELFFRSYLFTRMKQIGRGSWESLILVNILFAMGHLYEGDQGAITALMIGSLFSFYFIKRRNIFIPSLIHGFYNFTVLTLSLILS